MVLTQMQVVIAGLSAGSLFLHLCSAGNFDSNAQTWFVGNIFGHIHSLCNIAARLSLLATILSIAFEYHSPGATSTYTGIDQHHLPQYWSKLITVSLLATAVRFILPGPCSSFSRVYKLALLINLIAAVLAAMDANSSGFSGGGLLRRRLAQRKSSEKTGDTRESRSSSTTEGYIPSKRHRTAMELLQTETSYLRNLNTIIKVYKEPLERMANEGRPLLAQEDIRSIFGGIPDIERLHSSLHQSLSGLLNDWEEGCCIAEVINKYKDQLMKVYPPYVNFFDLSMETLLKQQKSNPELAKFFQECMHEPQSLKQPLDALLIRPVQRLPSINLLVGDLRRRTPENLEDYHRLEESVEVLKSVLSHINEDKRKMEGKTKMVDIIYQVDNCPVELVSSNRAFVARVDVTTQTGGFYRVGERLALYLLTDVLEIAKWRRRSYGKGAPLLKHVDMLPLQNITLVMDMSNVEGCKSMFAVKYASTGNSTIADNQTSPGEEVVTVLQLIDDWTYLSKWMSSLCERVAHVKKVHNSGDLLKKVDHAELLTMLKPNTKLHKKLIKAKSKSE